MHLVWDTATSADEVSARCPIQLRYHCVFNLLKLEIPLLVSQSVLRDLRFALRVFKKKRKKERVLGTAAGKRERISCGEISNHFALLAGDLINRMNHAHFAVWLD
jgi:hypothetical protein